MVTYVTDTERRFMAKGEVLRKWQKANQYRLVVDFNRNKERDKPLIKKLDEEKDKSGKAEYVKRLIERDLDGESK